MAAPEYLVCLNCETPCYVFEWRDGVIKEAFCEACGNDDLDEFISPQELAELSGE